MGSGNLAVGKDLGQGARAVEAAHHLDQFGPLEEGQSTGAEVVGQGAEGLRSQGQAGGKGQALVEQAHGGVFAGG